MKKTISLLLVLLALTLTACGGTEAPLAEGGTPAGQTSSIEDPVTADGDGVDLDLTQLSGTMVYSQIYDMICNADAYLGKTVKIRGLFSVYEDGDKIYYACVIQDATACCAQGLEFTPADNLSYPEDFPELDKEITVVGTFDSYQEQVDNGTVVYLVLRDAALL